MLAAPRMLVPFKNIEFFRLFEAGSSLSVGKASGVPMYYSFAKILGRTGPDE
jgi:hypothetical protein